MPKPKTHFVQVSLETIKKLVAAETGKGKATGEVEVKEPDSKVA
jgi:hypothetical protein